MNIAVRPASLSEDREELIALLERNLPNSAIKTHFKWHHEDNPAGSGWSWVLYDRQSGALGAMTSVFPRPMYMDGKPVLCGQVGEFVVDKNCRSLGPAVMLQRATFQPVDSGALALCYDCPPHDQGMSTFVRLGMRPSCEVTRYALPLRSDEVLGRRLGKGAWTKPVIAGANLLLSMKHTSRRIQGLEICSLNGEFGDEFTYLDNTVISDGVIRASRSAELLNWRYRKRPDVKTDVLAARQGGELLSFLAFIVYEETKGLKRALIGDLFGRQLSEAGLALLDGMIEMCRRKDVVCLEGYCSETSALKPLFEAAGFRARERAARVVAYAKSGAWNGGILNSKVSWPMGPAEVIS
jgi:hypothetical protein